MSVGELKFKLGVEFDSLSPVCTRSQACRRTPAPANTIEFLGLRGGCRKRSAPGTAAGWGWRGP